MVMKCKMKNVLMLLALMASMPVMAESADAWDKDNYLPINTNVKIDRTNLPIVFIDTKNGGTEVTPIHRTSRIAVRMKIINNKDGINYGDTVAHPGQKVDYEGWVGIKYRGNSSFEYSKKKPMGFKTLETNDVEGKKEKVKILGMPKDNDWVLLAPYHDRSMIRDVMMFQLEQPYFEYTPQGRHCELVMDGIYRGVYILCERPGKGKNRLNLEDPGDDGDALTGGYFIQIDYDDEEHYHLSKYPALDANGKALMFHNKIYFVYKFPEYEDMMPDHPAQVDYIDNQIDRMEDVLKSDSYKNPETGYRRYIDVTSFVDNMLSQEFSGNPDAYRRSTNLYKRRDSEDPRFKMCIWDFNLAFGGSLQDLVLNDSWYFQNISSIQLLRPYPIPFWWARMMEDPYFFNRAKARWTEYRHTTHSDEHIAHEIDSLVTLLNAEGACERNYTAYPNWDENIWLSRNNTKSYDEEIAYLKSWIAHRVAWLDEQLGYDPTAIVPGDVNRDWRVDVGDIMAIINFMAAHAGSAEGAENGVTLERADVNGDGRVDVGDIMAVINYMAQ